MFDIILKGGRLIDPLSGKNDSYDVAIRDGKVVQILPDIEVHKAEKTFPLRGKIIVPGIIDAHCHPVGNFSSHGIDTDVAGIESGVLLVNDGGTSGCSNFFSLKNALSNKDTEVRYFINLAASGLIEMPEIKSIEDIDIPGLKRVVKENQKQILGLKLRIVESLVKLKTDIPLIAKQVSQALEIPLMIHLGEPRERIPEDPFDVYSRYAVSLLEKGDILSHFMTGCPGGMVDVNGDIYPELKEAKLKGVYLDSCHGKNNFSFTVASRLIQEKYLPDIISTDLTSIGTSCVQSLLVTMSKFLTLGMSLVEVITAVTSTAAEALGIEDTWGRISEGRDADISILNETDGEFDFYDGKAGNHITGKRLLEPVMVLKKGIPYPCRSFYHLANENI